MTQITELAGSWNWHLPAFVMAGATTDREDVGLRVPFDVKLVAAYWTPQAAVTANGTNYSTLSVRNRKGDASGAGLPATRAYSATDSVAFVPEAMTLSATAATLLLSAGDILTVQMIHTASGLVIPAGTLTLQVQGR